MLQTLRLMYSHFFPPPKISSCAALELKEFSSCFAYHYYMQEWYVSSWWRRGNAGQVATTITTLSAKICSTYWPLKSAEFTIPPPMARARPNFPMDSNSLAMTAIYWQEKRNRRWIALVDMTDNLSELMGKRFTSWAKPAANRWEVALTLRDARAVSVS